MNISKTAPLRIGLVGAGLIGHKRAEVIRNLGGTKLLAVADIDFQRAKDLAEAFNLEATTNWRELVSRDDIDVVVVAVPNKFAPPITIGALKAKKHVLCEKPFGRNTKESLEILAVARENKRIVKVGFNHRFHPAIWKAHELFRSGAIGKLLFIRSRYGHGGRLGMQKEWRLKKDISGGGELLDQGVHVIDLVRWFTGDLNQIYGVTETKFWKSDLEDNAFAILKNRTVTVSFHVSTTNWKNIFSFEIFGEKGFLTIDGLGRSYGLETLTFGKRKIQFGVPDVEVFEFPLDTSWQNEWASFVSAIQGTKSDIADGLDGYEANRIVEAVYRSSRTGKVVVL